MLWGYIRDIILRGAKLFSLIENIFEFKSYHSFQDLNISCGSWTEEKIMKVDTCSFWMEGVMLCVTGTIGLIGNILSIVVLSKPDMYNSFNQLLITLSTFDSIFIFVAIVDIGISR